MKIVFFGNTKYSNIGFQTIQKAYPVSLTVTIPNSPVKNLAEKLKVPVLETAKLDEKALEKIKSLNPDFLVVEDYGLILPPQALELPKYAPLNIHHSLLPKYRGPSPAPFAILNGDKISGVTIIKMVDEVDAGDILAQQKYELEEDETTDSLLTKLNQLGAELLIDVIGQYLEGSTKPIPQDNTQANHTRRFTKKDGYFDLPAGRQAYPEFMQELDRKIRAYYPWPGVWTKWNGRIVKFLPPPRHSDPGLDPGEESNYLLQMEGKKPISWKDFLNGYSDFPLKGL